LHYCYHLLLDQHSSGHAWQALLHADLSMGAIVGTALAALVGCVLLVMGFGMFLWKLRHHHHKPCPAVKLDTLALHSGAGKDGDDWRASAHSHTLPAIPGLVEGVSMPVCVQLSPVQTA
jgi:hypothetical protein